jgi:hypothetical protein
MRKTIFLLMALLAAACVGQQYKVPPIKVDLPASYKSDTAAYRFITTHTAAWNVYGARIDSMYAKGEKWKTRDYTSLSERDRYNLVKLDYEYVLLWGEIDFYIEQMLSEMKTVMESASKQGAAKIEEVQWLFADYYQQLVTSYGVDLQLDKKPYFLSLEERASIQAASDSVAIEMLDSLAKLW